MSGPHLSPASSNPAPPASRLRLLTGAAITFLTLDALLLVVAGALTRSLVPFLLAGVAVVLALLVLVLQRRFTRRWEEIAADRRELRAEVQSWLGDRPRQ